MSEIIEYFQNDENALSRLLNLIKNVKTSLDISISSDTLLFFIQYAGFVDGCNTLLKKDV